MSSEKSNPSAFDEVLFVHDSPLFSKKVTDFETDFNNLTDYFKIITKYMNQFCVDMNKASKSGDKLQHELRNGLKMFSIDSTSSNNKIVNLMEIIADIFSEISLSQDILSVSLTHSFISPLEEFLTNELTKLSQLHNQYKKEKQLCDDNMLKYLHSDRDYSNSMKILSNFNRNKNVGGGNSVNTNVHKKESDTSKIDKDVHLPTNNIINTDIASNNNSLYNDSSGNNSNCNPPGLLIGPDLRAYDLVSSQKSMELTKFDIITCLNEIETKKSFEVSESCLTSLVSLRNYYNYCFEKLSTYDKFIANINKLQQESRLQYEELKKMSKDKRLELSHILDINVEKVTSQIPSKHIKEYSSPDHKRDLENVLHNISHNGLTVDDVEKVTNVASSALSKLTAMGVNWFGGFSSTSATTSTSTSVISNVTNANTNDQMKPKVFKPIENNNDNIIDNENHMNNSNTSNNINVYSESEEDNNNSDYETFFSPNTTIVLSIDENYKMKPMQETESIIHVFDQSNVLHFYETLSMNDTFVKTEKNMSGNEILKLDINNQRIPYLNSNVSKQGYIWERVPGKLLQDVWNREWLVLDSNNLYYIKCPTVKKNNDHDKSSHLVVDILCDLLLASVRESKTNNISSNAIGQGTKKTPVGNSNHHQGVGNSSYPYTFEVAYANFKTYTFQAEGLEEYISWIECIRRNIEFRLTAGLSRSKTNKLKNTNVDDNIMSENNLSSNNDEYHNISKNLLLKDQIVMVTGMKINNHTISTRVNSTTQHTISQNDVTGTAITEMTKITNLNQNYSLSTATNNHEKLVNESLKETKHMKQRHHLSTIIKSLTLLNPLCTECLKPNPDWISLNLSAFICIECSGVHRSLGVHISKVRSLTLDDLEPEEYTYLSETGNQLNQTIWLSSSSSLNDTVTVKRPKPTDNYTIREKYIRAKYEDKIFMSEFNKELFMSNINDKNDVLQSIDNREQLLIQCMYEACRTNNVELLMKCIVYGVNINTTQNILVNNNPIHNFSNKNLNILEENNNNIESNNLDNSNINKDCSSNDEFVTKKEDKLYSILKSPLHIAAEVGATSCVVLLLLYGAESSIASSLINHTNINDINNNNFIINDNYISSNNCDNPNNFSSTSSSSSHLLAATTYENLTPSDLAQQNGYTDLAIYIKNKCEMKSINNNFQTIAINSFNPSKVNSNCNSTVNTNSNTPIRSPSPINNTVVNETQSIAQEYKKSNQKSIAVEVDFDL